MIISDVTLWVILSLQQGVKLVVLNVNDKLFSATLSFIDKAADGAHSFARLARDAYRVHFPIIPTGDTENGRNDSQSWGVCVLNEQHPVFACIAPLGCNS